jgi:hypothetical protein
MSVYRAPSAGNGPSELENGLNPLNHLEGDQSAYVGSESVARDFADPRIGGYENGYINFQMHPDFETEFAPYRFRYDLRGPDRWEYQIPQDMIGRFNDLTINRSWIPM